MRLTRFAELVISLALATTPLWVRQYRLERNVNRWAEDRDKEFIRFARAHERWAKGLVRQVEKAFVRASA